MYVVDSLNGTVLEYVPVLLFIPNVVVRSRWVVESIVVDVLVLDDDEDDEEEMAGGKDVPLDVVQFGT